MRQYQFAWLIAIVTWALFGVALKKFKTIENEIDKTFAFIGLGLMVLIATIAAIVLTGDALPK